MHWLGQCRWVVAALAAVTFAPAQERAGQGSRPPPAAVPPGLREYRDLAYVPEGHERQKLDLYVPAGAPGPLPLIIWVHGGAWSAGDKSGATPLRQGYAQRGYAIASVNYRLSQHAVFPAQLEDCKAAVRWLRANAGAYNLDPERFGAWGSSAGGHLVALLGTTGGVGGFDVGANPEVSSRVQCVMDDFGPTDFLQMDAHRISAAAMEHATPASPESRLVGGLITDPANAERVRRANPITYVTPDDPPFLIVHGDRDPLVPHHQSELLFAALEAAGVPVRLNTVQGGGHGAGFGGPELEQMRRDFLDRHLKGARNAVLTWPAAMRSSTAAVNPPDGKKAARPRGKRVP